MTCESRYGELPPGPEFEGPALGSSEAPWPLSLAQAGLDGPCRACGAEDMRQGVTVVDAPDDGASLSEYVERPTKVSAMLRCGECLALDHREGVVGAGGH